MRVRSALRRWSIHSRVTMVVRYARAERTSACSSWRARSHASWTDVLGFAGAAEHP